MSTAEVTRTEQLSPDQLKAVLELTREAEKADGTPPLSEQTLLQLRHADGAHGVHLLVNDGRHGYAHLDHDGAAEMIIAPHRRGEGLGRALVEAALAAADGKLEVWSHGDHPAAAAIARSLGFERTRVLHRLRRPLSEPLPAVLLPDGVSIRSFQPGHDEEAWLRVNARAFATHPEQGRMTLAGLRHRMAEPWFEPAGFLLAERGAGLVGFHWTKVHPDGLGEIYVLGIDPDAADLHLGRPLAIAGLESLRSRGVETAMLYVDESNPRAMRLYEKLGFTPWSSDVTYLRTAGA